MSTANLVSHEFRRLVLVFRLFEILVQLVSTNKSFPCSRSLYVEEQQLIALDVGRQVKQVKNNILFVTPHYKSLVIEWALLLHMIVETKNAPRLLDHLPYLYNKTIQPHSYERGIIIPTLDDNKTYSSSHEFTYTIDILLPKQSLEMVPKIQNVWKTLKHLRIKILQIQLAAPTTRKSRTQLILYTEKNRSRVNTFDLSYWHVNDTYLVYT